MGRSKNSFDKKMAAEIYSKTKNPHEWLLQAEYLNAAGDAVMEGSSAAFKQVSLEPDMYKRLEMVASPKQWMTFAGVMLYGFALENLLKGHWVLTDTSTIMLVDGRVTTEWDKDNKGHNLIWLAGSQSISLDDAETQLLDFLTKVTTWGGRYPAPKNAFWGELGMEWNEAKRIVYTRLYEHFRKKLLPSEISQ